MKYIYRRFVTDKRFELMSIYPRIYTVLPDSTVSFVT